MVRYITLPWEVSPSALEAASFTSGLQSSQVSTRSLSHKSLLIPLWSMGNRLQAASLSCQPELLR